MVSFRSPIRVGFRPRTKIPLGASGLLTKPVRLSAKKCVLGMNRCNIIEKTFILNFTYSVQVAKDFNQAKKDILDTKPF